MSTTLYEKIGGKATLEKVVDEFHKLILADSSLNAFFANTDMEKQGNHQVAFFSQILGGPNDYQGRSMDKTHSGMSLQQPHFDAIVKHLTNAMTASGVSSDDTKAVMDRVANLKGAILNK
ncbi:MAG: group 1 truncated hemoglobin [Cyanobacteria bacterium P01_A01_bin.84]